jgi:hypothetical protein
VRQAEE